VSVLRSLSTSVPGRLEHSVEELQTIVDAAERRDADAVSALCALHVKNAGRAGLEALAEQGER
jgi:DNA-binding GntR family transcriptional regulator